MAQNSTNNGASRRHNERLLGGGTKRTKREAKKEANPDDANKLVRSWVDDFNGPGADETRRRRQRRLRCVTRFLTKRGNKAILIEGDDESIDQMEAVIIEGANDLFYQDGGRDTPIENKRCLAQREYDAVHQAITVHHRVFRFAPAGEIRRS